MCVYLHAKFQVSSIVLMSFRWGNFTSPPLHNRPLKSPLILGLSEGIDFNNLTYYYTSKSAPKYFVRFKDPLIIYNDKKEWSNKFTERRKNSRRISIRAK